MYQVLMSIIIPAYNCEKYIRDTVNSLLNQNFEDIEIIIVDDGSTDSTGKICDQIAEQNSKVFAIHQCNGGAPKARNNGLKRARGKYVIFFDSDDILIHNILGKAVLEIERTKSDLLLGNLRLVDENLNIIGEQYVNASESDIRSLMCVFPYPGTKVYKRSIIDENQIIFDNVKIGQDLNFYLKYLSCCNKVSVLQEVMAEYRQLSTSISHEQSDRILDIISMFDYVDKFYKYKNKRMMLKYLPMVRLQTYIYQYCKIGGFSKSNSDAFLRIEHILHQEIKNTFMIASPNSLKDMYLLLKYKLLFIKKTIQYQVRK